MCEAMDFEIFDELRTVLQDVRPIFVRLHMGDFVVVESQMLDIFIGLF